MAHYIDVRIDGVTKMADNIAELPSFHFEGNEVIIRATLVNEPEVPDVPRMNYDDIQSRLASEPADSDDDKEDDVSDEKPKARKGGRKRGQPDPQDGTGDRDGADATGAGGPTPGTSDPGTPQGGVGGGGADTAQGDPNNDGSDS